MFFVRLSVCLFVLNVARSRTFVALLLVFLFMLSFVCLFVCLFVCCFILFLLLVDFVVYLVFFVLSVLLCGLREASHVLGNTGAKPILHPSVQEFYPVLGLGSGGRLLRHFQIPTLHWIHVSLRCTFAVCQAKLHRKRERERERDRERTENSQSLVSTCPLLWAFCVWEVLGACGLQPSKRRDGGWVPGVAVITVLGQFS